jgi:hypothetical protein
VGVTVKQSILRQAADAADEHLIRIVRWARKADDLRGVPLEMVPREALVEEAQWQIDPHQYDSGMYR